MIRYLASGYRDFNAHPSPVDQRFSWEVYVVADGFMAPVFPDRKDGVLKSEYAWVFPPGLSYGWMCGEKPPMRYVMHFTTIPNALKQAVNRSDYFERQLTQDEIKQFDKLYHFIERRAMSHDPIRELEVERATIDIALLLLKGVKLVSNVPLSQIDANRVESVLVWYREHMSECPTIDAAAAAINLSAGHLRRIFQQERDCSPHQAFINLRLERAKELLSTTSQDLLQIARQCGFTSDSDFCRVFSKYAGVSPHKWRIHITRQEAHDE